LLQFGGSNVQKDPAYDLALVNPLETVGINLFQRTVYRFTGGGHAQRPQGFNQFSVVLPGFKGRLLCLPLCSWLSTGPHSIEDDGLAAQADASCPNIKTLLLQFQVENRTLTRRMLDWPGENARLH